MEIQIKAAQNSSGRYTCYINQLEFIVFEAENDEDILKKAKAMIKVSLGYFLELVDANKLEIVHRKVCKNKVNGNCPLHNLHCSYPDCEM